MNSSIKRCGAPQGSSEVLPLTTPWSGHRNKYLPNFDIVYYKWKFKTMIHLSYLYVSFFACMHECVPCVLLVPTEVKKKKMGSGALELAEETVLHSSHTISK